MITVVNNFCSIGIIFPIANPRFIFTDIKWQYPVKAWDNMICPQGGNWFGPDAKSDGGPLDTLRRELSEELSFEKSTSGDELSKILDIPAGPAVSIPAGNRPPTEEEKTHLREIVDALTKNIVPFGDFYSFMPRSILDAADPANQRGDAAAIVSAWCIPLSSEAWNKLAELQKTFGNLSNESRSVITSIDRMIASHTYIAFGHDRILQAFWQAMGIAESKNVPLVEGIEHRLIGTARSSWTDYFDEWNPTKRPEGF